MYKPTIKIICYFVILLHSSFNIEAADIIIFSYNRPLQLEALLESLATNVKNCQSISILFRAKGEGFQSAYRELESHYPNVIFYEQHNPPSDFKPLLINLIQQTASEYICFAVDDIIITDNIDLLECTQALEQTDAYGFFLRLGVNITHSYNYNIPLTVPALTHIQDDVYSFNFEGKSYWEYPNTVDMTVYKKTDILPHFIEMNYSSPNRLESAWNKRANLKHKGLCYSHSKIINTPLNIVQEDWISKHDSAYLPDELLSLWQLGMRIDIKKLHKIDNISAHISYEPHFIKKDY